MAYNSDTLLYNGAGQWAYGTADAVASVLATGYFKQADIKGLKYGHAIRVTTAGDAYDVKVTAIEASGAATAELVGDDVVGSTALSAAITAALATAFASLPTADPVSAGALWNDSGVLKISEGE